MKVSQLRNIIKEEISKALKENDPFEKGMENLNDKIGVKPTTSKNVMKYETLPGYDALPPTRKDINWDKRKSIILPSNSDPNAGDQLMSKEDVKEWYDEFVKKFKETPKFEIDGIKIKVLNGLKPNWKGMKDFGGLD